jgi:hypothetical protein
MFKIIKQHGMTPKFYNDNFQYADNSQCGWFAIFVAKLINKNKDADIFELLDDVFGSNGADDNDIKVLEKAFGRDGKGKLDKKYDLDVQVNGSGILDFIKGISGRVKGFFHALKSNRTNFKPSVRQILESDGNFEITSMNVCRTPLKTTFNMLLNVINKVSGFKGDYHDRLFHLFIVVKLSNGRELKIEKNEDVNISTYKKSPIEDCITIPFNRKMSINDLLNNTLNSIVQKQFFDYNAISSNCQRFIFDILKSNGLLRESDIKFIMQKVDNLIPQWAEKIMYIVTSMANRSKLITEGYGKFNKE